MGPSAWDQVGMGPSDLLPSHGGVHDFWRCAHGGCTFFFSNLSLLVYIGRVHGAISGCTVLGKVHPVSAGKKKLNFGH